MAPSTAAVRLLSGDKEPVRFKTTGNHPLSGLAAVNTDGVTPVAGDRVLLNDQTDATANGIRTASEGTWQRAPDFASSRSMIAGMKVAVQEGDTHAGDVWSLDTNRPNIGDDDIEFSFFLNTDIADDINAARESLVAETDAIIATALAAGKATQPEAEAGVSNVGWMTPLRTKQAIAAQVGSNSIGQYGDGVTDATDAFNDALSDGNLIVPPGDYVITDDVPIPSNRFIWIQKGANLDIDGGRFTAHLPGAGNVELLIDGVMYFHDTVTAPPMGDWPVNGGGTQIERGCIEMGGSTASPAANFRVHGSGRVYSDYEFTTVADTGLPDIVFQLNRKGIAFFNCHDVLVFGLQVDHIHGEAVYCWGGTAASTYNVRFLYNDVQRCAFDALNFNTFTAFDMMLIAHNRVTECFAGVELSGGTAFMNSVTDCHSGINTGGGGGPDGVRILSNTIKQTISDAINVAYDLGASPKSGVIIEGNSILFPGAHGVFCQNIIVFRCCNNLVEGWATQSGGTAFAFQASTANGLMMGNFSSSAGIHSTGGFVDVGTANTKPAGTNPVI